jgi:hypothetical protein
MSGLSCFVSMWTWAGGRSSQPDLCGPGVSRRCDYRVPSNRRSVDRPRMSIDQGEDQGVSQGEPVSELLRGDANGSGPHRPFSQEPCQQAHGLDDPRSLRPGWSSTFWGR